MLSSCHTRRRSIANGNPSGTGRSYTGSTDRSRSTDIYVSSDYYGNSVSPVCNDWGHPAHHPTPYRSRDDERKNASHRTDPRYRDPHHGGSRHGHDAAGHRVDSHGHHVDQFGNHTRTPDVIVREERSHRESASSSPEPSRSSSPEPSRSSSPDPSPASSAPSSSSSSDVKTDTARSSESTSSPERGKP